MQLFVLNAGENARMDVDKDFQRLLTVDESGVAKLFDLFSGGHLPPRVSRALTAAPGSQWNLRRTWQAHNIVRLILS